MKVLHVITGLQKAAGTSVFCVELCNHLQAFGVECAICAQSLSGALDQSNNNVARIEATDNLLAIFPFKPDLVHFHALWSPFLHRLMMSARKQKIPYVISPHGMLTPWALDQKRLKKKLALALYQHRDFRLASLIHATAPSEVNDIRHLGLRNPVCVVPLGVEMPSEPTVMRHNQVRTLLFVSRVQKKKGLLNLVKAWKVLLTEQGEWNGSGHRKVQCNHPLGWRVLIAGPDQENHAKEVKSLAVELGVAPDFEFLGPVYDAEKAKLYASADCFVLPSYSENFGSVVIEALAHGCPVITTKGTPWEVLLGNPASSEVLECGSSQVREEGDDAGRRHGGSRAPQHESAQDAAAGQPNNFRNIELENSLTASGRCGWWIDIGIEPLVEALREAMALTDEERHQMGLSGHKLVEARYRWPAIAGQMKSAYDQLIKGGQTPDCFHL